MAMNPTPPTPDALQTIVAQLQMLCRDWERAINGPYPNDHFCEGQRDAWRQAQRQIGALIESIKVARSNGIYLTDAQKQLVALIEDRHKDTMRFLRIMQARIRELLTLPEEPNDDPADDPGGPPLPGMAVES